MKVELIKGCSSCHYAQYNDYENTYFCSKERHGRHIKFMLCGEGIDTNMQPPWCPLPDMDNILHNYYNAVLIKEAKGENPTQSN
jgi:hypothetical protein